MDTIKSDNNMKFELINNPNQIENDVYSLEMVKFNQFSSIPKAMFLRKRDQSEKIAHDTHHY
jgi:hypothetical protein